MLSLIWTQPRAKGRLSNVKPVLRKIIRVAAKDTHCEGFCVR